MTENQKPIQKELNVEKLNIVEPDGTVKLSFFNSQNVPPAFMDGEVLLPGHRQNSGLAGMVFYNTEGDECGGLMYGSEKKPDGGYHSELAMAFDQYKNDQIIQMKCTEDNKERTYGFVVYDRPDRHIKELLRLREQLAAETDPEEREKIQTKIRTGNAERLFAGKKPDGSVGLHINDSAGRERIRIVVDADDEPHVEILNSDGDVIRRIV